MTTTNSRQLIRAATVVMAAFAVSRVLGLVRTMVFGLYFGTGAEMDAFTAAARIPDMLFMVVAGGALGSAFIPIFAGRVDSGDESGAWRLASAIVNLLLMLLVPLSLLAILLAPWLVQTVVAPEFSPELQVRIALLMRMMLFSSAIFGVSGVVMGVLNARQHFLLPALAPIIYNLIMIGGVIWGGRSGSGAWGGAIAMVVGSLAHLAVQLPALIQKGARYTPTLALHDPDVLKVGRVMAPRVLGVAAVQLNFVVTNNLASRWGVGAISALSYAWALVLLPSGIFAQAIGTVVFPTFSVQAARGDMGALRQTLSTTLRTVFAAMLPAAVGLMVLGRPIVALLLERGAFESASTEAVTWALAFFAVGLIGHAAIEILARVFYALHDTWTPALAAMGAVLLNVALGLSLPPLFAVEGMPPYAGLALANGLSALLETGILLVLIGPKLGGLEWRPIVNQAGRVLVATAGMAVLLGIWLYCAPSGALLQAVVGVVLGMGGYFLLALGLRIEELQQILHLIQRKVAVGSR